MMPLSLPERRPGLTVFAVAVLFAAAYVSSLFVFPKPDGRMLMGDALHHYVQLRSLVFDGDLHFQNEYRRMYRLDRPDAETSWIFTDLTATGHVRNLMPVGPALLWAPAFLLVGLGVWIGNLAGAAYPLDGYGRVFQATAGLSGTAAAALGVWLSYRTCRLLFTDRTAIWTCLTLWLASSAVYYSVISPTYSHAASLLASSAFWYAFVRSRSSTALPRYATLGALAGLAALMRWQDAVLLAVVAVDLVWRWRRGLPAAQVAGAAAVCVGTAAIVFTPQMAVWQVLYGQPLALPQGGGFMRWTDPAIVSVLFSTRRGLLTWTPIVAVALAGFVPLFKRDRFLAASALTFFAISCYVNAAVADWWAGEAFGARRFVSCFPVFALGLAALVDNWRVPLRTLALSASLVAGHTFLLLLQYQAFMKGLHDVVPYPRTFSELWLARFRVPFDLLAWWLAR